MIRVLLVDRSNSRNVSRWCDAGGELSVFLLPEKTDLPEALTGQKYDIVIVHENPGDSAAIEILRQIRDPEYPGPRYRSDRHA